jgi:hypothetical protein
MKPSGPISEAIRRYVAAELEFHRAAEALRHLIAQDAGRTIRTLGCGLPKLRQRRSSEEAARLALIVRARRQSEPSKPTRILAIDLGLPHHVVRHYLSDKCKAFHVARERV